MTFPQAQLLEQLARAEADARDARNYVAEVAQGVSHYPHEAGEPCVRCAKEQLEERLRVCLKVNEDLGKELLAAERGGRVDADVDPDRLPRVIWGIALLALLVGLVLILGDVLDARGWLAGLGR